MTSFLVLVINVFAVHRLTKLVIDDKITETARNWVFDHFGQPHLTWTYLFTCPWCVSIWMSAFAVIGFFLIPAIWTPLSILLALSSLAGIVYKFEDRA